MTLSSAQITADALDLTRVVIRELEPVVLDQGYYDWTNLQGAESDLLAALVKVRIAKVGVLRRRPSFPLADFAKVEADMGRAAVAALDAVEHEQLPRTRGTLRTNPAAVARRQARLLSDGAAYDLRVFKRSVGTPGSISGERMTAEQRAEYDRLVRAAETAYAEYDRLTRSA